MTRLYHRGNPPVKNSAQARVRVRAIPLLLRGILTAALPPWYNSPGIGRRPRPAMVGGPMRNALLSLVALAAVVGFVAVCAVVGQNLALGR